MEAEDASETNVIDLAFHEAVRTIEHQRDRVFEMRSRLVNLLAFFIASVSFIGAQALTVYSSLRDRGDDVWLVKPGAVLASLGFVLALIWTVRLVASTRSNFNVSIDPKLLLARVRSKGMERLLSDYSVAIEDNGDVVARLQRDADVAIVLIVLDVLLWITVAVTVILAL